MDHRMRTGASLLGIALLSAPTLAQNNNSVGSSNGREVFYVVAPTGATTVGGPYGGPHLPTDDYRYTVIGADRIDNGGLQTVDALDVVAHYEADWQAVDAAGGPTLWDIGIDLATASGPDDVLYPTFSTANPASDGTVDVLISLGQMPGLANPCLLPAIRSAAVDRAPWAACM